VTARILKPYLVGLIAIAAAGASSFGQRSAQSPHDPLLKPGSPEMNRRAPDNFSVQLQTTKGRILIELHRSWAPHGVDRFYNLVARGYYNDSAIFRVIAGKWAQFGINGNPEISQAWRTRTIPDDQRVESNVRGAVFFAFKEVNGRTTQVVINLRDNSETFDKEPFVPIGKVVKGMYVADALYSEYGEQSGGGIRAGKQDALFKEGNKYLKANYPKLDYIVKAAIEK
jgi:cyclophilin family peptidyl-prolyl cis-trans isomerase